MDVLMAAGSEAHRSAAPRARWVGFALLISMAAHAGVVGALALLPLGEPSNDESVEVVVVAETPVDVVAPPAPESTSSPADDRNPPRAMAPPPAATKRAIRPTAPPMLALAPVAVPAPLEEPLDNTAAVLRAPSEAAPTNDDTAPPAAAAKGGATSPAGSLAPSGSHTGGDSGSGSGRGMALDDARRRALVDRYRQDVLRTRVASHFRYPPEARELELVGQVVVTVTVGRSGQLMGLRLSGRCPHATLCEDGLRTLRASAPFPPIPADLGETLRIDVPLNYAFE